MSISTDSIEWFLIKREMAERQSGGNLQTVMELLDQLARLGAK